MSLAKPGDVFTTNNPDIHSYVIKSFLGEGVTAEVYHAVRQDDESESAALKILRPSLPQEIAQSFKDEARILAELTNYGQRRFPDQPVLTPKLLGQGIDPSEFIALEFITGQALDDLILETGGLAVVRREVDALIITQQVLQVLQILHEDIRRSYTDFQLKNIRWQEDPKLVKVMDWNHVSERSAMGQPATAPDDLIRLGAYLYQLLTGKGALQSGEPEGVLARRAESNWESITLGTRAIICRALHPNSAQRYQQSTDFLADVTEMLDLWVQDLDDLYDVVSDGLRQVRKRNTADEADDISAEAFTAALTEVTRGIDLYIRRSGEEASFINRLHTDLQELTAKVSATWGAGFQYYQAGIYSQALQRWEPEAKSLGRLDLWRWVLLARIAREMGKTYADVQTQLEQSIEFLSQRDWTSAQELLAQVETEGVTDDVFFSLVHETTLYEHLDSARHYVVQSQWQEAGQAYEQAADTLMRIKDEQYVAFLAEQVGTPEQLQQEARGYYERQTYDQAEGQRINHFRFLLTQKKFAEANTWLSQELYRNPRQLQLFRTLVSEVATLPLEEAIGLLSTAMHAGSPYPPIREKLFELRQKWREQKSQEELDAYQKDLDSWLEDTKSVDARKKAEWLANQERDLDTAVSRQEWGKVGLLAAELATAVPSRIKQTIQTHFNQAVRDHDAHLAQILGKALIAISPDEKQHIAQQQNNTSTIQAILLHLIEFDTHLRTKYYNKASLALTDAQKEIDKLSGAQQETYRQQWSQKQAQLHAWQDELIENPEDVLKTLTERNLQGLSRKLDMKLQELIELERETKEELAKMNTQLQEQQKQLQAGRASSSNTTFRTIGLVLATMAVLLGLGMGAFYFLGEQIIATIIPPAPTVDMSGVVTNEMLVVALETARPTPMPTADTTQQDTNLATLTSRVNAIATSIAPSPTPIPSPTIATIDIEAVIETQAFSLGNEGEGIEGVDANKIPPHFSPRQVTLSSGWQFISPDGIPSLHVTDGQITEPLRFRLENTDGVKSAFPIDQTYVPTPTNTLLLYPPATNLPEGDYTASFILGEPDSPTHLFGEPFSFPITQSPITVTAHLTQTFRLTPEYNCSPPSCDSAYSQPVNALGYFNVDWSQPMTGTNLLYATPFTDTEYILSFEETVRSVESNNVEANTPVSGSQNVFKHPATYFLLVQIPNEQQLYWLAEKDIVDFYNSERWRQIIEQLPNLATD